jgi:hypothetical protein
MGPKKNPDKASNVGTETSSLSDSEAGDLQQENEELRQRLQQALTAAEAAAQKALEAQQENEELVATTRRRIEETSREQEIAHKEAMEIRQLAERAKQQAEETKAAAEAEKKAMEERLRIISEEADKRAAEERRRQNQSQAGVLGLLDQWNQAQSFRFQNPVPFGIPSPAYPYRAPGPQMPAMQVPSPPVPPVPGPVQYAGVGPQQSSRGNTRHVSLDVPLPRERTYDGKMSWESFIRPFEALASTCGWDNQERLFRLTNCLRGEAAEYVFCNLAPEITGTFERLVSALETRFKDQRAVTSYLAQLEVRKLQQKEGLSEYVADIKRLVGKGYPTADEPTRDTIALRHFLKGLPDQQMAVAVGMTNPKTVEEARTSLENYNSLKDEMGKTPRVRAVQPVSVDTDFVTRAELRKLGQDLNSSLTKKF